MASSQGNSRDPKPAAVGETLDTDLKASLARLRESVLRILAAEPWRAGGAASSSSPSVSGQIGRETPAETEVLYTPKGVLPGKGHQKIPAGHPTRSERDAASPLQETLDTLLKLVDGALARTRVHQLMSLPDPRSGADPTGNTPLWTVEIPLPGATGFDSLRIRMEETTAGFVDAAAGPRRWRVMLSLECASLGPIHALVELSGQRLGTTLWAEREGTLLAARAALSDLEATLRAQGVLVERVECLPGRPPETSGVRFGNLLDVRT